MKTIITALFILCVSMTSGQGTNLLTNVLIITAHPDDESGMAGTIYKITHELNGNADLAVITNGEAGYKYSLLAEPFYHLQLTNEEIGRKHLPTIRKKELMAAGNIIGIRNYYFFDQQDNHYTLDADTVLTSIWDVPTVKARLKKIIQDGSYDFIFCLLPTKETHGHHKAATIIALETLNEIKSARPIILAVSGSEKTDSTETSFNELENYPLTKISSAHSSFRTDRTKSFGFKNQLNYKIIVNWEIAEHKSQGSMQTYMNKGDFENFWYFDMNGIEGRQKCEAFFRRLENSVVK